MSLNPAHRADLVTLAQLVKKDSLPPVLLFEGREGIGKRDFALASAALFFCQATSACGTCGSCRWIFAGEHPDVLALGDGASLKVEDAERLQEHLAIKASRCSWTDGQVSQYARRVVILYNAERLTGQAANRILKTLEEPPPYTSVLLTTSARKLLLPTLLSRCVRWHLRPAPLVEGAEIRHNAEELTPLLHAASIHARIKEAEGLCRQKSWSASELARQAEYALNQDYRRQWQEGQRPLPWGMQQRRSFLRRLKELSVKQKIALNAQLAAENLGIMSLCKD